MRAEFPRLLQIRIDPALRRAIEEQARRRGVTLSAVVRGQLRTLAGTPAGEARA